MPQVDTLTADRVVADQPRPRSQARSIRRSRRRVLVLAPIIVVCFAFYSWTAATSGKPITFGKQHDYYNQLTSAFLRGHLSLLTPALPGLKALRDPYNPVQNAQWHNRYYDLAYYHGHLYLPWGPTPVVTLLMPWRILHLGQLPVPVAVLIFCCVGLLFAVALLCRLVDRYLPGTRLWQLALATLALALCNVAPFLLRRPDVYELAVASGYCFAMIGAYFLARGSLGARARPWSLAVASLSLGLAVGGRPTLIASGLLLVGALYLIVRRDPHWDWERLLRFGAILIAPFAAIVLILFAYNYARFGSFLQYGVSYTLAGADFSKLPTPSLTYLAPGLYSYLVSPVRWTFSFPYFAVPPPPAYPGSVPSYYYSELTGGLLTTAPIVVATAVAAPILWRKQRQLVAVMLAFVGVGAVAVVLSAVSLWETTMRYEADFATFFVIPGLLAWFALSQRTRGRIFGVVGAVLVLYGALVGAAISLTGYYDDLRYSNPGPYWALARATSFAPTVVTMIEGHPVIARAFNPFTMTDGNADTYELGNTTFGLSPTPLEVDIISPDNGSWSLAPTFQRVPNTGYPCCFEGFLVGRNQPADIIVISDGKTLRFPLGSQPRGVTVPLGRGLNRVELLADTEGLSSQSTIAVANGLRISHEVTPRQPTRK